MGVPESDVSLERLRDEVEQTKALFEGAKDHFAHQLAITKAVGRTHPDGDLNRASAMYVRLLDNYRRALWRYNRFVLDGKLPDEQSDSEH